MARIIDLKSGDLFIWDIYPKEIHQYIGPCTEEDGTIQRCEATEVVRLGDEHMATGFPNQHQYWNPYCEVRVVRGGSALQAMILEVENRNPGLKD